MKRVSLLSAVVLVACTSADPAPPPPIVTIHTSPCNGDAVTCINAGTVTRDVAGVHVIHKRVSGDPVVAVHLMIDGGDRGGLQLWSEWMALDMLRMGGSSDFTLPSWRGAKSAIGASIDAAMGLDYGRISGAAPVVFWNDLWSLLTKAVERPVNDDYLLDFLHGYLQGSFDRELDDPDGAAGITASSMAFGGTLGNRFRESHGDAALVAGTDVDEAWTSMLTKDRLWVVVAGDIQWSDLESKVQQAFGNLPARHRPGFPAPRVPGTAPTESRATILDYPESPHWQIVGEFRAPPPADPDYAPLAVAMQVLDQRLFAEVRDTRGLAYSVGAFLGFDREPAGGITLATSEPSKALPVVRQTLSAFARTNMTGDELTTARALLRSSLVTRNTTPFEIAYSLGEYQLVTGDRLGIERYSEALAAVTPEAGRVAFERYFRAVSIAASGSGEPLDDASLLAIVPGAVGDAGTFDAADGGAFDAADGQ